MCGIFGIVSSERNLNKKDFKNLALLSRERGKDSSGFVILKKNKYFVERYNQDIKSCIKNILSRLENFAVGHSRLITNSTPDNQPIVRKGVICIHNGIITNFKKLFLKYKLEKKFSIDTEIIPVLIDYFLKKNNDLDKVINQVVDECKGIMNCAVAIPKLGKVILFSNNGSLYIGKKNKSYYFASEKYFLKNLKCNDIQQIYRKVLDISQSKEIIIEQEEKKEIRKDFVPALQKNNQLEKMLIYENHNLKRCSKCILPFTMPFIYFDEKGVCNYCINYKKKNFVKYTSEKINSFFGAISNSKKQSNCIIPLSGGRDSSVALHLAKKKFNLKPIAYTYDWGLVTDIARRNISRMCSELDVENIIFADDISKKRNFIKKNVSAWLKNPHLGMVNLFTAGDKHFFRHVQTVKKRTGIQIDLWGINPYEVTHFKSGFLGVPPEFDSKDVFAEGLFRQLKYHTKRFKEMIKNPTYFNMSIFDNLHGEFYRSIVKKKNYYSIFDFHKWNENEVEEILKIYDWEKSVDTKSTWRIGDGAAAFYNYIYYTMAGFSEQDTFRSNQIREGDLTRDEALNLVKIESKPRFKNIKWFLEIIDLDFIDTIKTINSNKLEL